MFDKNTIIHHSLTTVVYIFSKYVHCDMNFLDVKIGALFCFLNAVPVFIYKKHTTRSSIV